MAKVFGFLKFKSEKGFGFITPLEDEGHDVFVHSSGFIADEEFTRTEIGDRVSYMTIASPKGFRAVNVTKEDKAE